MEHTFVNICEEKFTIKEELLNVTEQETDRAQHRLESKHYEVNTDLQIERKLLINKYEDSELKDVKNFTIKSEILDITEQPEEADLQVLNPILIIKKNESDEEGTIDDVSKASEPTVHKDRVACETIKQEKDLSVTPLSYGSNGLPFKKELSVVFDDVKLTLGKQNTQDSFVEATNNDVSYLKGKVQAEKNKETGTHPTINNGTLTNSNNMDANNKNVSGRTSTVNSNIDFTHYDAESSKNVYICDICNKSYQRKKSLYQHIQQHLNLFNCTFCSYTAHNKGNLNTHINAKHTKNIVYNCSHCNYRTCVRSHLSKHMNGKHIKNVVYINCSYCSFRTSNRSSLSKHVNSKHTKKSVHNCLYCSYKTYYRCNLSNHVNSKHTKCTVYNCSHCSYSTYNRSNFSNHVNSKHIKNTVYNCTYCDYKSFRKGALNRHINTIHTKINVFHCSYCNYKSYENNTLAGHINSKHNKNTVLKCGHCSYETHDKSNLRKHIKAKHIN